VELMNADVLGGHLDALNVGAGLEGDSLGGFAVTQRDQFAVVRDRKIALNILIIFVAEIDIDVERLALLAAGRGDELVHHDFMLDIVLQGHDIDGDMLTGGGGKGGAQIAGGGVAVQMRSMRCMELPPMEARPSWSAPAASVPVPAPRTARASRERLALGMRRCKRVR